MRWTIWRVWVRDAVGQWNVGDVPDQSVSLLTPSRVETKELVSASFTDEDVERVAEALQEAESTLLWDELGDDEREWYFKLARAALSAYLEPTTKGDT